MEKVYELWIDQDGIVMFTGKLIPHQMLPLDIKWKDGRASITDGRHNFIISEYNPKATIVEAEVVETQLQTV